MTSQDVANILIQSGSFEKRVVDADDGERSLSLHPPPKRSYYTKQVYTHAALHAARRRPARGTFCLSGARARAQRVAIRW